MCRRKTDLQQRTTSNRQCCRMSAFLRTLFLPVTHKKNALKKEPRRLSEIKNRSENNQLRVGLEILRRLFVFLAKRTARRHYLVDYVSWNAKRAQHGTLLADWLNA